MHAFDRRTDRHTDGQTEFSSLDRVCIPCSSIKMLPYLTGLFGLFWWNNWRRWRHVFWGQLKRSTFQVSGKKCIRWPDLRIFSDLEMTWLSWHPGAATALKHYYFSGSRQPAGHMSERGVHRNKKLRYREEHSASVVLSWCNLRHLSGDKQQINS